jgi:rhamnogalacturonyl hydrolase YesR
MIGQINKKYLDAASREQNYVINIAPRAWNGAISQRYNTPEVWADFIYMVPPFLAYYAVATANTSLLRLTIQQCGLYRQILQANMTIAAQKNVQGVWEHIIGPNDSQPGLWSTGNGWAAAGMTRVLATTLKWEQSASWAYEQGLLTQWIKEIIDGTMQGSLTSIEPSTGLLRNYLNDTSWFGETSGTALISSVLYRMAVLAPEIFARKSGYIAWAEKLRKSVAAHVEANGIFSPAVNPLNWGDHTPYTTGSPEGQSFGLLLAAAYRDWICTP